jgi:hypothetical protein
MPLYVEVFGDAPVDIRSDNREYPLRDQIQFIQFPVRAMLWGMSVDENRSRVGKQAHLPTERLQKSLDGGSPTFWNVDEGNIIIKNGHRTFCSGISSKHGHGTCPFARAWNPALPDNDSAAGQ